jgi:hypothetical protein
MAAVDTTEAERLLDNRIKRFLVIQPDEGVALELAMSGADLHLAEDLAEAGCPPELIARILL